MTFAEIALAVRSLPAVARNRKEHRRARAIKRAALRYAQKAQRLYGYSPSDTIKRLLG